MFLSSIVLSVLSRKDGDKYGIEEKSTLSHVLENQASIDHGATLLGHISK